MTTRSEYMYLSSSMVKQVAMFGGDISEDIPNYSFTVIFHQPNVPESVIKNIIEDLKPAHLSVTYSYEYTGTFEFAESENEYNIGVGFADGNGHGGYLGNI